MSIWKQRSLQIGEEFSKTKVLRDYRNTVLAVMKLSNVLISVEELRKRMLEVNMY